MEGLGNEERWVDKRIGIASMLTWFLAPGRYGPGIEGSKENQRFSLVKRA